MLQTYQPMLLAALRPAPLMVGWDMGNPDWYSSPFLDVCFAGHPHATMEARCESVYLPLGMTRDHAAHGGDLTRADLGIPADGPLLMTSGSPDKLGGPVMWQGLRRLLEGHPGRLLVLGPTPEQVAPHQKDWDAALRDRCHVVPRRPDFAAVMGVCDVYVDTVPVGGGFAVMEAMRQDKPCVLVHHDLGRIFDKRANYNTMSCYGLDPEIAVPANDRDAFVRRGLDLLGSAEARQRQIERQRAVIPTMTQPYARMPLFEAEVLKRLAAAS
jgi:predicted O-linked N-acetylglucosamine transferase (SPINDLY family)